MMLSNRSQSVVPLQCISGAILSFVLMGTPVVLAHGRHGDDFQAGGEVTRAAGIRVGAETAKRLGIKVEPVNRTELAVGIKTTGQIETLPSKKVEVTTPIPGTIVELLVEPGASVKASQPVALLSSPDLVELRVESQEKRAEAAADLQQAQADLKLAQQNLERQRQIAAANIEQTRTELEVAQERYDRDRDLVKVGALPRRQMLESQAHLAAGKTQLAKASSRREALEAEAQLKRAQSAVEVAQSRIRLSNATYQTRLAQLGTRADAKGLVTVTTPISGKVADREVTLGQSFEDAGGKLMTIVNDSRVFATANIYEKDLNKVETGQRVSVKAASLPNRTFTGRITRIGSVVEGERVVPVQAELDNSGGQLKPGMFAQLEVLTDQTPTAILVILNSAVVEANGKKLVYVQNGDAYQSAEVSLGQTSEDRVEVKSGLFDGDRVVTQGAMQLYAQSLRGGNTTSDNHAETSTPSPAADSSNSGSTLPWWLVISAGGAIAAAAFWVGRRTKPQLVPVSAGLDYVPDNLNSSAHKGYAVSMPATRIEISTNELSARNDNHHFKNEESGVNSQK